MQTFNRVAVLVLACALAGQAQGNSWNRVRYNGGTLETKVSSKEWKNQLTVTSEMITLRLKDGQILEIPAASVTGLSYGQEAHRRVGTMIALGILVAPLALFGLFHKTRLHFIGIEYETADGKKAGVLLQGHKNNYRAILMALRGATGAQVAVAEEDRKYVPTGVETTVARQAEDGKQGEAKAKADNDAEVETVVVAVSSVPEGAEIYVDGEFMGNTPSKLNLKVGKRAVRIVFSGYKEWVREVSVSAGSELSLTANLEKLGEKPLRR